MNPTQSIDVEPPPADAPPAPRSPGVAPAGRHAGLAPAPSRTGWADRLVPVALAAAFFAALAPTLSWVEFVNGSEDSVVATALDIRRGGPWWVPQLFGEPRTRKPPVAAWAAAAGVRPSTAAALNSPDAAVRDRAYRRLNREVRWIALAAACGMVAAVYGLGRILDGWRLGPEHRPGAPPA